MTSHREGVNPLRPYYIPPSIGEPPDTLPTPGPHAFSQGHATGKYASKARDIFSDLDYKDYISEPSPSVVQTVKELVDELLWKYTSVLMAQPFEVAKLIQQVRSQDDLGNLGPPPIPDNTKPQRQPSQKISMYDEFPDSDSDPEEPAYFTSNHHPSTPTPSHARSQNRAPSSSSPLPSPRTAGAKAAIPEHQLTIRTPDSILEVIAQLWQKEGAWGVWKGSNATFIYSVLQSLLENWSRSLLSALFNVPDLGVRDDMDRLIDIASPYPWASLFVAAAAAVVTGVILSPLDLVRTRLIVTSTTSRASRRTLSVLRNLPSYFCPPGLFIPTVLHSLVHPLLTLSTPLVLRSRFMIDREVSPVTFSVAKFCTSSVALFVKLPLETVLRRGQVSVLSRPDYIQALDAPAAKGRKGGSEQLETIVPVGQYKGVFGTMYAIVNEEGSRPVSAAKGKKPIPTPRKAGKTTNVAETVYRRGQGLEGLWRGWKVSWWGLVGLWSAGVLGGGGDGEF
ncbi:mitochondrial fusion and transport protein ugo1 [Diplogelasinospora grovesii]|uniref:Mitochondrial fusion and transport protein ugo1 n=1 Tax=Diplogelasinospora grovesii TaxID=303347 RepID=A0AAN6NJ41_9PEZI|nr:mitochondrial fusion and transport protein ugo1 [Diplogelasinospora grovesii]